MRVVESMRAEFARAFDAVDLVATPTTPGAAFALGEKADDPLSMYLSDIYTTPANLVGLPAVALPSGLDERGLPLSLQLLAPPFAEALAGRGTITGTPVRCEAPEWALRWHTGYPPRPVDRHDVTRLCERFGLPLPDDWPRNTLEVGE